MALPKYSWSRHTSGYSINAFWLSSIPLKMRPLNLIPRWCSGKESSCQVKWCGFDWVGKLPWRRQWQPTPVFLPGEFHAQRSLATYSPWDPKELDVTENTFQLQQTHHTACSDADIVCGLTSQPLVHIDCCKTLSHSLFHLKCSRRLRGRHCFVQILDQKTERDMIFKIIKITDVL